ncbi:hypothetical protein [Pelomicrobium methylotrophicum]|uniref:Uncharacterized protein n=1 Tax=Pelomicrobium methylotrophicum TaxID=2602750 RepID=A0A5C7ENC7_9PROT|nr:hypothetical protein [Pelomicrobium methylotrophicum]TXF08788.1 hypothetical protein FR698_16780 [Pelomicrobium methylotrophicum]
MEIKPDTILARRVRGFYGPAGALFLVLSLLSVPFSLVLDGPKMLAPGAAVGLFLLGCGLWARAYSGGIPECMMLEGDRLRIVWPDGRIDLFPLDNILIGSRGMLAGSRWVAFYAKFRGSPYEPLYDARALGPLLLRAPEAGAVEFFLEGLKRGVLVCWGHALIWVGAVFAIAARLGIL